MSVRCALPAPITLAPGTYWITYMLDGTLASGPWVPPITVLNDLNTGNAIQFQAGAWAVLCGLSCTGIPFRLHGSGQTPYSVAAGIPGCSAATLVVGAVGNLGGLIRADLHNLTAAPAFPALGFDFTTSVLPLCSNGSATCTAAHGWAFSTFFSSGLTIPVPPSPALFGALLACQGAEFNGAGACPGLPIAFTNSVNVTLQF